VPGDLDRPTARGVLGLLRAGARPCGDAADVLAARPERMRSESGAAAPAQVLAALAPEPRSLEALAAGCGLAVGEVLAELLQLAWAGLAEDAGGQRWRRRDA
jgi:predicted Rossmann fold nucleotide-binding protein DprA/Smf involved in DNA uptake